MTAFSSARNTALGALTVIAAALLAAPAHAQKYPVTAEQRAKAQATSEKGIPVSELAPNAPDTYVVKRGDTLWGISGMYLKRPWRWPELWGMNLQALPNPHLIFPGQTLYLDKDGGYARLRTSRGADPETVRVSPRTRTDSLAGTALPTLKAHLIEPFLVEPIVVDADVVNKAPRMVATVEDRVLISAGDRAYVRGDPADPLRLNPNEPSKFRIFRKATPMVDPLSGEVLGYEAQYLGQAELVRGESVEETSDGKGKLTTEMVPATVDVTTVKEEVRVGDRLLPAPPRAVNNYVPRAPKGEVEARVVSIYGSNTLDNAAQNQVIAINKGTRDGVQAGYVLRLLTKGDRVKDKTEEGGNEMIKLPSENNGLAMVFRTFDRVSYVLILDVKTGVRVGDRLVNPE